MVGEASPGVALLPTPPSNKCLAEGESGHPTAATTVPLKLMQTLDMAEGDEKKSLVHSQEGVAVVINDDNQKADILKKVFQVIHFGLAVGMFVVGLVEFCVEPTIFDIFGRSSERRAQIPEAVFKVSCCGYITPELKLTNVLLSVCV